MRSKAVLAGHPLHPILIPFPFAFLTGGFFFSAAALVLGSYRLATTASSLVAAGLVMGLVAAGPGLVDLFGVVPPSSSARRRGLMHAAANVSALALFAAGWWLFEPSAPSSTSVLLQLVGLLALSAGGWMGGTLVYRNQIAVDHRYANAGRWHEVRAQPVDGVAAVTDARSLKEDQMLLLHAGSTRIAVGRSDDACVAFQDRCTHKGGPLSDGVMACGTVQCPWHGSQFDVRTGEVKAGPAKQTIAVYDVDEQGGTARVHVTRRR